MFATDSAKIDQLQATKGDKLTASQRYGSSQATQMWENTKRWWALLSRDVGFNQTRLIVLCAVGLLYGGVFFRQQVSGPDGLTLWISKNGVFYAACFFTSLVQGIMVVPVLANSKAAYYRERSSLTYSTFSFLFGRTVCELPWIILVVSIWMVSFYPMAGLYGDAEAITLNIVALCMFCFMMINLAELFSVLLPSSGQAEALYATLGGIFNLFAGFFMPVDKIPWPWKVIYYVDPARFGVQSLSPAQFWCTHSCLKDNPGGSQSVNNVTYPEGCQTKFDADGNMVQPGENGTINENFLTEVLGAVGPGCITFPNALFASGDGADQVINAGPSLSGGSSMLEMTYPYPTGFVQSDFDAEELTAVGGTGNPLDSNPLDVTLPEVTLDSNPLDITLPEVTAELLTVGTNATTTATTAQAFTFTDAAAKAYADQYGLDESTVEQIKIILSNLMLIKFFLKIIMFSSKYSFQIHH